jgi:hypothetical protein
MAQRKTSNDDILLHTRGGSKNSVGTDDTVERLDSREEMQSDADLKGAGTENRIEKVDSREEIPEDVYLKGWRLHIITIA